MDKEPKYSPKFFQIIRTGARLSATAIVPLVMEWIRPTSVVDVGCGTGEFLRVFQEYGVKEILGIDGEYIDENLLAIPQASFKALDISEPFSLDKIYDLALCLEVAEHLAPERASDFILSLTQLAPVVLFSAAIPHQGGPHHINEQWPDYWVRLFQERRYIPVDALRKRIWNNRQVDYWYRQNIMLFCSENVLASNVALEKEFRATNPEMLSIVHPELFILKYNYFTSKISVLERIKMIVRKIYHQT